MFTVSQLWHFGSTSPPRIFSNVILLGFSFVILFYQTCVTCPLICVFVQQVQVSSCFFFSTPRCPQRCHPRTPSLLHDILETVAVRMMESGKLYFQTGCWYRYWLLINSLVNLSFFISDWCPAWPNWAQEKWDQEPETWFRLITPLPPWVTPTSKSNLD